VLLRHFEQRIGDGNDALFVVLGGELPLRLRAGLNRAFGHVNIADLGVGNLAMPKPCTRSEKDERTLVDRFASGEHLLYVVFGINLGFGFFELRPIVLSDNPRLAVPLEECIHVRETVENRAFAIPVLLEGGSECHDAASSHFIHIGLGASLDEQVKGVSVVEVRAV
jgi:hypothetical protein